jgi:hypothetical protein
MKNEQDIFDLVQTNKLLPHEKAEAEDCLLSVIESNSQVALDRVIILTGANLLDRDKENKIRKNITEACALVAKNLGKDIKKIRINRLYGKQVNENTSDPDINKLARQSPHIKNEYKWDHGILSDPMKPASKGKVSKNQFKWKKDGLSPLSGKTYKVKA